MILPKFALVLSLSVYPLVGSQTLSAVPPAPFGTPFTLTLQTVWSVRSTSPPSFTPGTAWLRMLKSPTRNCNFRLLFSPIAKFLKSVMSWFMRVGMRM